MKRILLLCLCTFFANLAFSQTTVYLGSQITNGETGDGCVADCAGTTLDPANGVVCILNGVDDAGNHTSQESSTTISVPAGQFLDITIVTNDCTGATDGLDGGDGISINGEEVVTGSGNLQVNYSGCFSNPTAATIDVPVVLTSNRRDETVIVTYTVSGTDPGGCTALPVQLSIFEGKLENDAVVLRWRTESEQDNDYFQVERSLDGKSFEAIGKVQGEGTTVEVQEYSYIDASPVALNYYRLKQVDFDGSYAYSEVITVFTISKDSDTKIYPTPTTNILTIEAKSEISEIQVMDITGKVVMTQQFGATTQLELNVARLVAGSYFIAIKTERGVEMIRFVKK